MKGWMDLDEWTVNVGRKQTEVTDGSIFSQWPLWLPLLFLVLDLGPARSCSCSCSCSDLVGRPRRFRDIGCLEEVSFWSNSVDNVLFLSIAYTLSIVYTYLRFRSFSFLVKAKKIVGLSRMHMGWAG